MQASWLSALGTGKCHILCNCNWDIDDTLSYDFDLRTGESETGLKACTYAVQVRVDEYGIRRVWVETPEDGTDWRLVELRPVSEGADSLWFDGPHSA